MESYLRILPRWMPATFSAPPSCATPTTPRRIMHSFRASKRDSPKVSAFIWETPAGGKRKPLTEDTPLLFPGAGEGIVDTPAWFV